MQYSAVIRRLHLLLALGITLQLVLSLVMEQPRPGRVFTAFQATTFTVHQYVGLVLFVTLVAHWVIVLSGQARNGLGHFFPWFSPPRLREVSREARAIARLRIGDPDEEIALAGAVQGLGLIIALVLAVTGTTIYFGMAPDGAMSAAIRSVRTIHTTAAPLMWGFLGIHVAAVAVHLALRHRSILAIFRVRDA